MHPILARGQRLGLYLIVFAQAGLLLGEILVRTVGVPRFATYSLVVPPVVAYALGCLASWYLCRRLPLGGAHPARLLAVHAVAGVLSSGLFQALTLVWSSLLGRLLPAFGREVDPLAVIRGQAVLFLVFGFLLYSLVAAVHYLSIALEGRRLAEGRAYELQLSARTAELRALKAQVDPHFLFNSLNAVAALCVPEPTRARSMCLALAGFLRNSLRLGTVETISLAEEVALAKQYLSIERERFGDRLRVDVQVAENCAEELVPPLLLQPLVENAVKHGVAHLLAGGTVSINVSCPRQRLRIEVGNPCDPDRPKSRKGEGIGLANVARRLVAVYGAAASIEVEERDTRFRVVIGLPRGAGHESVVAVAAVTGSESAHPDPGQPIDPLHAGATG
jgi:hypothetical protein